MLTIIVNFVDGVHNGSEFIRNIVNALNNKITKSNEEFFFYIRELSANNVQHMREWAEGRTQQPPKAEEEKKNLIQKAHCNIIPSRAFIRR